MKKQANIYVVINNNYWYHHAKMNRISNFSLLKTIKCKRETIERRLSLQSLAWQRINYAESMQRVRGIPERAKLKLSLLTQSACTSL